MSKQIKIAKTSFPNAEAVRYESFILPKGDKLKIRVAKFGSMYTNTIKKYEQFIILGYVKSRDVQLSDLPTDPTNMTDKELKTAIAQRKIRRYNPFFCFVHAERDRETGAWSQDSIRINRFNFVTDAEIEKSLEKVQQLKTMVRTLEIELLKMKNNPKPLIHELF